MLFLRHGHATKHKFGIDLLRPLSEEGMEKVKNIEFPIEFGDVIMSPAMRTRETAHIALYQQNKRLKMNKIRDVRFSPNLYAPILLPEMDAMYTKHGDHVLGYYEDKDIANTMQIITMATDEVMGLNAEDTLVVAHSAILNFIAHQIFGFKELLEIDLGTAEGFYVKNGWDKENYEIIRF